MFYQRRTSVRPIYLEQTISSQEVSISGDRRDLLGMFRNRRIGVFTKPCKGYGSKLEALPLPLLAVREESQFTTTGKGRGRSTRGSS